MKYIKLKNKYALGVCSAAIGWVREAIRDVEVALQD